MAGPFSFRPLTMAQAHTRAAAVLVNEPDASERHGPPNRQVVTRHPALGPPPRPARPIGLAASPDLLLPAILVVLPKWG